MFSSTDSIVLCIDSMDSRLYAKLCNEGNAQFHRRNIKWDVLFIESNLISLAEIINAGDIWCYNDNDIWN